jgi:hypothetical protein
VRGWGERRVLVDPVHRAVDLGFGFELLQFLGRYPTFG